VDGNSARDDWLTARLSLTARHASSSYYINGSNGTVCSDNVNSRSRASFRSGNTARIRGRRVTPSGEQLQNYTTIVILMHIEIGLSNC
jgi:hypothetical protein